MDLISVVIPTFNRKDYLKIAVDSVLLQTHSEFELIIVDDGSTDGTEQFLKAKYGDLWNIKIFYFYQSNQGESVARNYGLNICKGRYIAFLDSDDFWHSKKLEIQIEILRKSADRVIGVFNSVFLVDKEGVFIQKQPIGQIKSIKELEFNNFLSAVPIHCAPSNLLLKTAQIKNSGGFDTNFKYGEDQEFLLRLRENFEFEYIDSPLVYYRVHNSNQSKNVLHENISVMFGERIAILEKFRSSKEIINIQNLDILVARLQITALSWFCYYQDYENVKKQAELIDIESFDYLRIEAFEKIGYRLAQLFIIKKSIQKFNSFSMNTIKKQIQILDQTKFSNGDVIIFRSFIKEYYLLRRNLNLFDKVVCKIIMAGFIPRKILQMFLS